jgi:hypothetical protein
MVVISVHLGLGSTVFTRTKWRSFSARISTTKECCLVGDRWPVAERRYAQSRRVLFTIEARNVVRSRDRKLRATEGSALIELSRHVVETFRKDEDSIRYRGRKREDFIAGACACASKRGAGSERLKRLVSKVTNREWKLGIGLHDCREGIGSMNILSKRISIWRELPG